MPTRLGTTARLGMIVALIGLVQLLSYQVRAMLASADVVLPEWKIEEIPLEFPGWKGEVSELDERVFRRTGADAVADRVYENRDGGTVTAHTALFQDFKEAIQIHLPSRCYRAAGWEQQDAEMQTLDVPGLPSITVEVSTWQREGHRIKMLYWYQLGEYTVLDRWGLGKARMALAGQETWPAMVKVMLQTTVDQRQAADLRLLDVARNIRQWLHERSGISDSMPTETDEAP